VGGFGRNMPQPNLAAAHAPASKERPGRTGKSKAGRERSGCKRRHSLDQSDGGPWASWNRSPIHPILMILSYPLSTKIPSLPLSPTLVRQSQRHSQSQSQSSPACGLPHQAGVWLRFSRCSGRWASMGSTLLKPPSPIGHRVRGCMIEGRGQVCFRSSPIASSSHWSRQ
jgi:hypothetical protein